MSLVFDVEIVMATDGSYKASLLSPATGAGERVPRAEVWGYDTVPGALRALATQIEFKATREFTRRFEEDGA